MKNLLAIVFWVALLGAAIAQSFNGPMLPNSSGTVNVGNATGVLPVVNGGVDQTAWSTYSPTATCTGGTITTDAVAGRYKLLTGKTMITQITFSITTIGTCTGNVTFSLPPGGSVNVTGAVYVGSGLDSNAQTTLQTFYAATTGFTYVPVTPPPAAHAYFFTVTYETT
jgi:hypothetical protein